MSDKKQEVIKCLNRSKRIVLQKVIPLFNEIFNDYSHDFILTPIEGEDNELCKKLDLSCGVDYLLEASKKTDDELVKKKNAIIYALSSRVQYMKNGKPPYNSFTIRNERKSGAKTEYEKLCEAIKHDAVRPNLMMQVFCDNKTEEILTIGVAKIADIIKFINDGKAETKETGKEQIGQADFWTVYWKDFTDKIYFYNY